MNEFTYESASALAEQLVEVWAAQGRDGSLLSPPDDSRIETRSVTDDRTGVPFEFRWMPHRELRGDVAELEQRGILNPNRDEASLFRDPADPHGRHCFLCIDNIKHCHPLEELVPMQLADRDYVAGANFAWIDRDHYTVMTTEHIPQRYDRHVLDAIVDLHMQTAGRFRVLYNGAGAGASIPWHLHYQITTAALPIEHLLADGETDYPTVLRRFRIARAGGLDRAHALAETWMQLDPENHSLNFLAATIDGQPELFFYPRDMRHSQARGKGLLGGFEVSGSFVLSSPAERETFLNASVETARGLLSDIVPPAWSEKIVRSA